MWKIICDIFFLGDKMAKLYFRYGAMNCGKTTSLLQVAYNYKERGMNVLVLKPSIDKYMMMWMKKNKNYHAYW